MFAQNILVNTITVGMGGSDISTNTVVGYKALSNNTTGLANTVIGYGALLNNTTGTDNTAIGTTILYSNTTGTNNTGAGLNTLYFNTTGAENTSIGRGSLYNNISGSYNSTLGSQSLHANNNGYNTAAGYRAGFYTTDGSFNTFIGALADVSSSTITYMNSTAIGYNAIIDSSNQIVMGTSREGVYLPGDYLKIGGLYTTKNKNNYALDVDGSANFTGSVTAANITLASDYRIKEDITKLDNTFIVDNLNPVIYTNSRTQKQDVGFIAHELQEVYPFLVNGIKDGDQLQSVNYIGLIGILTKEIQEIKERVKILEER